MKGELGQKAGEAGLDFILVPLVELARALGPLAAQALLLAQPLLDGWVDRATLSGMADRLDNPLEMEKLLVALETGGDEQ